MSLPLSAIVPATRPPQAHDRLDELALAVAVDARDADDLAAAHGRSDTPAHRLEPAVVEHRAGPRPRARRRRGVDGRLLDAQHDVAADHHAARAPPRRSRPGVVSPTTLPVAHDDDAVGDRHDLVELVGDEDDREALVDELAHDREELVDLLRREHRRRLVEDEDARAPVERLEDLDALLHAHREVRDAGVRVDLQAVALGDLDDLAARGREVDDAEPRRLAAEHDVLGDRERLDQHEVLVHHADAQVDGLARAP